MSNGKEKKAKLISNMAEGVIRKNIIWLSVAGMFVLLCIVVWLDEVLDFPHLLMGAPETPANWQEAIIEMSLILVIGIITIFKLIRDITKYNLAKNALFESEKKMRTILNSMPDIVLQLDTNLKILWANKATLEIEPNAKGQVCYRVLHGRNNLCPDCPIVKALKTGQIERGIIHSQCISGIGESYWDDIGVPIKDAYGNIISIVMIARNITDIRRAEIEKRRLDNQYRQAQKMESVGRLAGGVAHDFNNMLGVILGCTELALNEVEPSQPVFASLQEIRMAAERSSDLTRKLLAFARRQPVEPKVLDLNGTVEGMFKILRRLIGEDVDLVWLPGSALWSVKIDPAQIDQILANLCVNARDAIMNVGRITIETGNIAIDEAYCAGQPGFVPGNYILLTVSDNGCGMNKETLDKLFEPFFTTKEVSKGTGLGLAMVYGIIKQNNGFISVHSEQCIGTTFRIYLPRYTGKTAQVQNEGTVQPVRRGHETILLVDDEPAIRKTTAIMLERQGYTVLAADTPGEAIRLAREFTGQIHLLLTDVVMPKMKGRELAKNILIHHPKINCLFMSGYMADVITNSEVLDEDVNFIQKPFTIQDLADKVRQVMDGS